MRGVSTSKQDLERQIDALCAAGIDRERIYLDKKSGATTDRPGLKGLLEYARDGDVVVVHTLDRLGRTVRDTLNLIHELQQRGVGVRNLADPIRVDSSRPEDPMAQLAVVLLALFAQMERTYMLERAAHARAAAKGRRVGRPSVVDPDKFAYAAHLREQGDTIADIVAKTGITRSSLYRHLPPRPAETHTATALPRQPETMPSVPARQPAGPVRATRAEASGILERVSWPAGYRPPCPRCHRPTIGLREKNGRLHGHIVVLAVAEPCGCGVDEHAATLQSAAPAPSIVPQ